MSKSRARDFAELSRQNEIAFALHSQRFYKEHVTAHRRPRETGRDADLILLQRFFRNDLRRPEKLVHVLQRHANRALVTFGNLASHLATDATDLAFELTQAGFLRVLLNDG